MNMNLQAKQVDVQVPQFSLITLDAVEQIIQQERLKFKHTKYEDVRLYVEHSNGKMNLNQITQSEYIFCASLLAFGYPLFHWNFDNSSMSSPKEMSTFIRLVKNKYDVCDPLDLIFTCASHEPVITKAQASYQTHTLVGIDADFPLKEQFERGDRLKKIFYQNCTRFREQLLSEYSQGRHYLFIANNFVSAPIFCDREPSEQDKQALKRISLEYATLKLKVPIHLQSE